MSRQCGQCDVCCVIAEVREQSFLKSAGVPCSYITPGEKRCSIFGTSKRPQCCSSFQCSWLRGFGSENSRPDKCGLMVSINQLNGGNWIFAIETIPNAFRTTGKDILIDIGSKIDLPIIVSDYQSKPPDDKGDYTVIKKSLLHRTTQMQGELLGYLDSNQEFSIFRLKF